MRLVIVGGSAHSTPQLFLNGRLADAALDVTLAARSPANREAVARAIRLVSPGITVSSVGLEGEEFVRALARADAIVIQIRVGGYAARTYDETFPLDYGICGDEGLGPGGLACAWRTWPALEELLATIAVSESHARIILLTSPIGILTRAALDMYPQLALVGICELPFVTLRDVAAATGTAIGDVRFTYAGVNHLGWFTSIASAERDLLREFAEATQASSFPSSEWIRENRVLPLKYLRLHYEREALAREQHESVPRGTALAAEKESSLDAYVGGDRSAVERALARRLAPWYADAVAPYLRSLAGHDEDTIIFLTLRNDGYLAWLAPDDVIEIPHRLAPGGMLVRALPVEHIPDHTRELLDALVAYERSAAAAVRARDASRVAAALATHPWVSNDDASELGVAVTASDRNTFR